MGTNFTDIATTDPVVAATINDRLDELDAAIGSVSPDANQVTYTPGVLTDWDGDADPGGVDNALDQLAERVDDSEIAITALAVLDAVKVSKLRQSDDGGDALVADADGYVTGLRIYAEHFNREGAISINDDAAVSRTFDNNRAFVLISTNADGYFLGHCEYNGVTSISNSGFSVVAGAGTLTGTTGSDGTVNVRMNAGTLYIENRSGTALALGIVFLGAAT